MHGVFLLLLQFGGTAFLILGMWLFFRPLVPHIRGWERWQDARVEFSPGEQGRTDRRRIRRAQLRAVGVLLLGAAAHGAVPLLRHLWFG